MKHTVRTALFLIGITLISSGAWTAPLHDGGGLNAASAPAAGTAQRRDDPRAIAALTQARIPLQRDASGRVRWIEAIEGEFDDEAMRQLPKLPSLEWLEIGGGKVTAAGVAHLKGCSSLKRLYIHDVQLGDHALSFLSALPHLEALSLRRTGVTGKALDELKAAAGLKVLNLSGDDIFDADLAKVARLRGLEVLALQDTKVTGSGLAKLAGMTRLNELNLNYCDITDDDLDDFVSMPNLRIVFAEGCNIHEDAIRKLNDRLPMLAIFP